MSTSTSLHEPNPAFSRKCLALNADGRPLQTWPLSLLSAEDAITAVVKDKAIVVEEWPEVFRSPSVEIPVPKTIMLRDYIRISATPKFCRRSILLRDGFRCQYCGQQFESADLTFDHVLPRAAKGRTEWSNILTCCVACNMRKRDHLPGSKGSLQPLKHPRQPTTIELLRAGLQFLDPQIRETWSDFLYWNAELDP
jgi:5-methylcytosine-specific restriction endonuclease McrA